jgi:hypothetical protein
MTHCVLLALAILRDEYALLDCAALGQMLGGACQDGCILSSFLLLLSYANALLPTRSSHGQICHDTY